ncbi:hypothetical protein [Janibacter sp. UYMM211]|uniref:hypothetical protein n=1 Tax=Janibacter sp. UYMM211 TaxID=3156342 RepID=UPI0033910CC2
MTWTRTVLAVALALPLLTACGSSTPCPEPVSVEGSSEIYAAQDADGVDVVDCEMVGDRVVVGDVTLMIPEPGSGVGGQGAGGGSDPGRGGSATTSSSGVLTTEVLE